MYRMQLNLSRPCEIIIGQDLEIDKEIMAVSSQAIIITDDNLAYLYKHELAALNPFAILTIEAGEQSKNLEIITNLLNEITVMNVNKNTAIIGFGGGVVGDIAGFLASILLRGIKLIQIPTTLIAMIDSSIGGKNGVNSDFAKNQIGTIYQPDKIIIDSKFLKTLSRQHMISGYAEILKTALISDAEFYEWLEENSEDFPNSSFLEYVIPKTVGIKSRIISLDEHDTNSRRLLNFGHSFGHAIEKELEFKSVSHGEAVAVGMIIALELGVIIGFTKPEILDRIICHYSAIGLPSFIEGLKISNLFKHMLKDKKNLDDINLILLSDIGQGSQLKINQNLLEDFLNNL